MKSTGVSVRHSPVKSASMHHVYHHSYGILVKKMERGVPISKATRSLVSVRKFVPRLYHLQNCWRLTVPVCLVVVDADEATWS